METPSSAQQLAIPSSPLLDARQSVENLIILEETVKVIIDNFNNFIVNQSTSSSGILDVLNSSKTRPKPNRRVNIEVQQEEKIKDFY